MITDADSGFQMTSDTKQRLAELIDELAKLSKRLHERWVATGLLVPLLWPLLRLAMARFREFGADLNARVSDMRSSAV